MRYLLRALLALCLFLIPLYVRARSEAAHYLTQASSELAKKSLEGDRAGASALREAISWHVPFNPYSADAQAELYRLAKAGLHTPEFQLETWRELRRGLMTSRSFLNWAQLSAPAGLLTEIDREIETHLGIKESERVTEVYPPRVHFGFQILAQFAFWGWIGSVLYMIFRGFSAEGKAIKSEALKGAVGFAVSFGAWVVALCFA